MEAQSDTMNRCANCGASEGDDIKLKTCTGCKSVKYCGVNCQKKHRSAHKKECKKRAAELHDEILFKMPESSHLGDCPICFLPLPLDETRLHLSLCCGKVICVGCCLGRVASLRGGAKDYSCVFCRQQPEKTKAEQDKRRQKRIDACDPIVIRELGKGYRDKGDFEQACHHLLKAAELGDTTAHYELSLLYLNGRGVEKDESKGLYHSKQAAIGGHPHARYKLGNDELKIGQIERAVKHFIIAAKLGMDDSLEALKRMYQKGLVDKNDFATALRGHQDAVDAAKSSQRDLADLFLKDYKPSSI